MTSRRINRMSRVFVATAAFLGLGSTIPSLEALSAIGSSAVPKKATTSSNSLLAPIQRTNLKSKIIRAAKAKDETAILGLVEQLASVNPTDVPTLGLMGYGSDTTTTSSKAPLAGPWKLLYTDAQDAEAPARTEKTTSDNPQFRDGEVKAGIDVRTGQNIDAQSGKCINFIKLEGDQKPFDQLEITIQMTPLSDRRVRLDFQKGRALNSNAPLPFLKDFKFAFPPAVVGDALARLKGKDPAVEPPAYFDILYIDNEIRVHRTGEGKIFVQQRGR